MIVSVIFFARGGTTMNKVYYDTGMTELPSNCVECKMVLCTIPTKKNRPEEIKKEYVTKRPKSCPLVEV